MSLIVLGAGGAIALGDRSRAGDHGARGRSGDGAEAS